MPCIPTDTTITGGDSCAILLDCHHFLEHVTAGDTQHMKPTDTQTYKLVSLVHFYLEKNNSDLVVSIIIGKAIISNAVRGNST